MKASTKFWIYATVLFPIVNGHPTVSSSSNTSNAAASLDTSGFINPTLHQSRGGHGMCVSGMVPVTASTDKNLKYNITMPKNQSEVTQLFLDYSIYDGSSPKPIIVGTQHAGGTFQIGATLCVPTNDTTPTSVQFLTHGVGIDRHYWDFAPGYSYVDIALAAGHAAFFYDRLGVGTSSKPNPLNVVQSPLQLEIANELIAMLRGGKISNLKFTTVVGAGQSFGSILTQSLTSHYPKALDAAILTGYSANATGNTNFFSALNFAIASETQPYRFSGLPNAYIVAASPISNQAGFFKAPGFDPQILSLADATKGLITIGELFSTASIIQPSRNFTGPVAVVNGDADLPFCDGVCTTAKLEQVKQLLYPQVSGGKFGTYIAPDAGHALGFHYTAGASYEYVQSFLKSNGV